EASCGFYLRANSCGFRLRRKARWVGSLLVASDSPLVSYGRTDRPQDAVPHETLEHRVPPDALVVSVGGVGHAPLAPLAHPRPRFVTAVVDPFHQDGLVRIDLGVDVGFVPNLKGLDAVEHRMIRLHDRRREFARAVLQELRANEGNIGRGVLETKRGAMN